MSQANIKRAAVVGLNDGGMIEVAVSPEGEATAIIAFPPDVAKALRRDLGIALKAVPVGRASDALDVDDAD